MTYYWVLTVTLMYFGYYHVWYGSDGTDAVIYIWLWGNDALWCNIDVYCESLKELRWMCTNNDIYIVYSAI